MNIALSPVSSSQIEAIGYDDASRTLAVQFKKGTVYHYANVPPEVYHQFAKAPSIGKYFGANIKPHQSLYPFTKVPQKQAL